MNSGAGSGYPTRFGLCVNLWISPRVQVLIELEIRCHVAAAIPSGKHKHSRLITQPASPSRYVPDGFQIDAAEHIPKSSDKMCNRRPFRYTAGALTLTVQPLWLPPLSRNAHLVAAVQKGSVSTVAKLLTVGVENRAFACLKIL